MLRPAERFSVNLQDPFSAARAGVGERSASAAGSTWLLLPLALGVGLAAAWLVHLERPLGETAAIAASIATRPAEIEPAHGGDDTPGWLGDFLPAAVTGSRSPGHKAGWPVVLQRAGDGAFYADIVVGGNAIHARIDPAGTEARLAATDLPAKAIVENDVWPGAEVELQHLRLPDVTFRIVEAPAEAVLGMAGLRTSVEVEETVDRLRLLPTQRQR